MDVPQKARERLGVVSPRSEDHKKILGKIWRHKRIFHHYHRDSQLQYQYKRQEWVECFSEIEFIAAEQIHIVGIDPGFAEKMIYGE